MADPDHATPVQIAGVGYVFVGIFPRFQAGIIIPVGNAENFKLVGVVLVQECYRNPHGIIVIRRNVLGFAHFNRVVVVVGGIFFRAVCFVKNQVLVALFIVQVREPAHTFYPNILFTGLVDSTPGSMQGIIVRNAEFPITATDTGTKPESIIFYQMKDLFVGNRVYVPK